MCSNSKEMIEKGDKGVEKDCTKIIWGNDVY